MALLSGRLCWDDARPVGTTANVKESGHVQSLVRAFSLLEVVADNPMGIRLRDLSRRSGLHKSTAFRMLRTLAMLGYVQQTEDGKLYRLGARLPRFVEKQAD